MMDKSKAAVEVFDRRATEYEAKYMDVSMYGSTLDLFCSLVKSHYPSVLELACGPGNVTRYLLDKRNDLNILSTDLSPRMIELAKQNNPEADFLLMDCRKVNDLEQQFDAVMCAFCLPYLDKVEALQLIKNCSQILDSGGVIYISTMEDVESRSGYETSSYGDTCYINYHQADYLVKALKANGFTVKELTRQEYVSAKIPTTDLILIALKN
jgi:2-polyprenyl-3-methyl-5-hydroxy-6-metoxy-1,4-benzoquinol methylase